LRTALGDFGPGSGASRLASSSEWPWRGLLLLRPDWLFLDEATASLDPISEERFYTLLQSHLPRSTIVSIAHRESVARFHHRTLRIEKRRGERLGSRSPRWAAIAPALGKAPACFRSPERSASSLQYSELALRALRKLRRNSAGRKMPERSSRMTVAEEPTLAEHDGGRMTRAGYPDVQQIGLLRVPEDVSLVHSVKRIS
jgi:hypothetical protein